MTKEQAKALGLDDAAAEKVAAESAKELKEYVKKSDYDTLTAEKAQLEKDVKTRDGQIEQLKKADPEKLQQTITDLQTQSSIAVPTASASTIIITKKTRCRQELLARSAGLFICS